MNEPIQITPSLTLLEDEGEITLRVGEQKWAAELGRKIVSLVAEMEIAKKLTIVTPGDTKVFKFKSLPPKTYAPLPSSLAIAVWQLDAAAETIDKPLRALQQQDHSAPPSPELASDMMEELARQEQEEQEVRSQQIDQQKIVEMPEKTAEDAPAPARKRGRPSKVAQSLRSASPCGRCGGGGLLEGGGGCPVCQGAGSIVHYGRGAR